MRFSLLLFAVSAVVLCSCDKDPLYQSPIKLLTQKPWLLRSQKITTQINGAAPDTTYPFELLDSCAQDDRYIFEEGGAYRREEGDRTCTPSLATEARWEYMPQDKELIIDGAGRLTWNVLALTTEEMILQMTRVTYSTADTITRTEERRYTHP